MMEDPNVLPKNVARPSDGQFRIFLFRETTFCGFGNQGDSRDVADFDGRFDASLGIVSGHITTIGGRFFLFCNESSVV